MATLPTFIQKIFNPAKIEQRANVTDSSWFQVLNGIGGSGKVAYVTPRTAMSINAVYSCVNLITETCTLVTPKIYRNDLNGKYQVTDHDQVTLLTKEANSFSSSVEFDKILTASYLIWGNGYAEIVRNGRTGRPVEYVNLAPWCVDPDWLDGEKVYVYTPDSSCIDFAKGKRVIKARDMIHLADLSWNNLEGESRINLNKSVINEGQNIRNYSAQMYENGAQISGLLIAEKPVSGEALELVRSTFSKRFSSKAGEMGALPPGFKYQELKFAMPMTDANVIEANRFNIEDIARIFRCPLSLLNAVVSADNKGDKEYNTFLSTVIAPLCILKQAEYNRKIFRKKEMIDHYVKYEFKGLYRVDMKERYEAHQMAINSGWMNADEVRQVEDMNPTADGSGREYKRDLNSIPASQWSEYFKFLMDKKDGNTKNI